MDLKLDVLLQTASSSINGSKKDSQSETELHNIYKIIVASLIYLFFINKMLIKIFQSMNVN